MDGVFAKHQKPIGVLFSIFLVLLIQHKALGISIPPLVFINESESLPLGLYVRAPSFSLRNGDIVAYQEPEIIGLSKENGWTPKTAPDNLWMLKHVAISGSPYHIGYDHTFYVNGKYIGQIAEHDSQGHTMPQQLPGNFTVPDGKFLPYTPAPSSFDGRYTGVVDTDKIGARIIPIITW